MLRQPIIDSYTFGQIGIDGQTYTSDVIVLPTRVIPNWWRKEGHSLVSEDLAAALEPSLEILIVGQGADSMMHVPEETVAYINHAGIQAICLPTAQAVEAYNENVQQGKVVAAALHLTC